MYTKRRDKIKSFSKTINGGKTGAYYKDFMRIKFNSTNILPLNKMLNLIIIVRFVFQEDGKYYPQMLLAKCLYKLWMLQYDRIDISEVHDVKKRNTSTECDICYYWYFEDIDFKCQPYLWNGCHNLMQKATNFNYVAIFSIKESDYRIYFWYMGKYDAISIIDHSKLCVKSRSI